MNFVKQILKKVRKLETAIPEITASKELQQWQESGAWLNVENDKEPGVYRKVITFRDGFVKVCDSYEVRDGSDT